jgi:hypothetical protein
MNLHRDQRHPRPRELLERIERDGSAALRPVRLTPDESKLIGNAINVNPYEPLMHYMSLGNFMRLLTAEQLHMRRLDTFKDDPLDSLYPEANKRQLSSFDSAVFEQMGAGQDLNAQIISNQAHRKCGYAHCWYAGLLECKLMWERFGDQGRGVCLRSTPSRLGTSVKPSPDLFTRVCGVTYLPEDTPITTLISFLPLCRKRPDFTDQREFRLIAEIKPGALPSDADGHVCDAAEIRLVPLVLDTLLEAVVAGPNLSEADVTALETDVHRKVSSRVVRRSELTAW